MVFQTRLHPSVLLGALTTVAFIGLVVGLLIGHNDLPASTDVQIVLAGAGVMAMALARPFLRWSRTVFLVTDRRLLAQTGAVRESILEVPLDRTNVVSAEQGRRGHGTVTVTAADGRAWRFGHVVGADGLAEAARAQSRRR
ncbi:MAG TPA: PH domain-containing protein [Candidatus Binatia bacterium]|nr:PH domain-containing protein [Candidatus Binatia bacterium]